MPSLTNKPIRILIVEDVATDAELLTREIKRAGIVHQWTRVETREDFLTELANAPDVILSDYSLPHFDGIQALTLLRQCGMDTPFILVSGTLGEEAAVEAMKLGANDYILKDRTARLGQAILRAIEDNRLRRESKRAAEELHATNAQLHQLLEYSPAVIYALKLDGEKLIPYLVSENVNQLLGFTVQETLSYEWWLGQLHPDDRDRAVAGLSETLALGSSLTEYRVRHKNGSYRWVEDQRRLIRDKANRPRELTGVWMDITDRRRAEDALRESERRFNDMLANVELVSMMLDAGGRITYCNDYLLRLTGRQREEVIGRDWVELFIPPALAEELRAVLKVLLTDQPSAWHHENDILTSSGAHRRIRWNNSVLRSPSGEVIGIASIGEDITDREKNERLALRSQRLEAIGTLAGGVAHDLNNALAPILMGLEILKSEYPKESNILDMFQSSARRGAEMVRQLLSFAKGAEGERVLIQPAHLIKEMQSLITGSFPKNIQLVVKCEPQLPMVLGDATQLHQILLNLCVNARDAMPDGGILTLDARHKEVDAVYAGSIPDGRPGNFVVLRVRDTGTGIPPEILDRIFEPFFTTKGPEKGTGLGLSTVMGIVKGHGGFLHVYSQPGQGSTFATYLPENKTTGDTNVTAKETEEFHGKGETILFVDDEPALREVGRAVLRRLNFKPVTAIDGADGLVQAALNRNTLRAIITDIHMPQLDGLGFIRSVRRMLPDIPIIIATGRLEEPSITELKMLGVTNCLEKPFTEIQLAEALKNLFASK